MFSTFTVTLSDDGSAYRCENCGSWFTKNIVPEIVANRLYSEGDSAAKWKCPARFEVQKSRKIITRLESYFVSGAQVLDVGCNTGELLDFAAENGCKTFAVEPSSASREVLSTKGHSVFRSLDDVSERFDVITAFDVVEHLYDVQGFLCNVRRLLKKGGVLIILTGDVDSLGARLSGPNWWYLGAPEHIVFPSKRAFRSLDSFRLVAIDRTYASVGYKKPAWKIFASLLWFGLIGRCYEGLPPPGPDHMLITLERTP